MNIWDLSIPLTIRFNQSRTTGNFPYILRTSKVLRILKTDPPSSPKKYRPISSLNTLPKVFELLIKYTS